MRGKREKGCSAEAADFQRSHYIPGYAIFCFQTNVLRDKFFMDSTQQWVLPKLIHFISLQILKREAVYIAVVNAAAEELN